MTVRLHFRAEVKDAQGRRVLVVRATDLYNHFLRRVRSEAKSKGTTEGTMVVHAKEWSPGEFITFDL